MIWSNHPPLPPIIVYLSPINHQAMPIADHQATPTTDHQTTPIKSSNHQTKASPIVKPSRSNHQWILGWVGDDLAWLGFKLGGWWMGLGLNGFGIDWVLNWVGWFFLMMLVGWWWWWLGVEELLVVMGLSERGAVKERIIKNCKKNEYFI